MMMDSALNLRHYLERSGRLFPSKEIVTRTTGGFARYTYGDYHRRTHRLAHALAKLDVREGDRVASLAWNHGRHLELYYGVPSFGAVLLTLNLRLPLDQLAYIVNHADAKVIFVDAPLLHILEEIKERIPGVRHLVAMREDGQPMPASTFPLIDYEDLLAATRDDLYPWPELGETAAAGMCYTSGTTGNPKGVLYTHRSLCLHNYALAMADSFAFSERDTLLQIVPMFHANGWGMPFAAVMCGSKIVLPGAQPQPADLAEMIERERVTIAGGVPTIWIGLYRAIEEKPVDLSSVRMFVVAGSAMPRQLMETYQRQLGIRIVQAWGMTETTPIATLSVLKSEMRHDTEDDQFAVRAKQGIPLPGVELRVVDECGKEIAQDGETMGELQVRGPWVTSGYYDDARNAEAFQDGWFRTGDVVTLDPEGYIHIMDRTKDLVKSGGEWISSVDLENAIMAHPKVLEACVIAVYHLRWHERPLAVVAPTPQYRGQITRDEILEFLAGRVAKWWLPDDVIFVDSVPKTSVGKFNKKVLREQYKTL
ncbi:MAG: long-chain fatty acid--CoA ligase [Bryobacteraceae bacterium]